MSEAKCPHELARDAAEAIRSLNHTTMSEGEDWRYPSDLYSVVGSLAQMAWSLPQLLEQTERLLTAMNEGGRIEADDRDPERLQQLLGDAHLGLGNAAAAARQMAGALGRAHSGLGGIAGKS